MAANISRLHPRLRHIARNLPRATRAIGFESRVTSGYRSPAKQLALYRAYLAGTNPYPVSPPGTSLHEVGFAIDVVSNNQRDLVRLLTNAGLSWAGPADEVHFTLPTRLSANAGQKSGAFKSWAAGPGANVPAVLGYLPAIGGALRLARDPLDELKKRAEKLLDVVLSAL